MPEEQADAQPPPEPEFGLWPENVDAWQLFLSVRTQFRHASRGIGTPHGMVSVSYATGLDYDAVISHMHAVHVPRRKFAQLYRGVRACEQGALQGWTEQRAEESRR